MSDKQDIYSRVTNKILADLERDTLTWLQPWQASHQAGPVSRPLRAAGAAYRGVNVLMLWAAAMEHGFSCPIWMTYKQARELGGQVRKGEKGSLVVYADTFTKTDTDDSGDAQEVEIPFMKGYTVFNVEQIDGLPGHFYALPSPGNHDIARLDDVERFFAATGAAIRHGGDMACYHIAADRVHMPELPSFRDAESYYATLAHEMTHWTRHPSRLDRDFGRKRFGDAGYAMEELVAEIGAAFLCADLGITPETREDHAAYIATWLKVLREDKRAIFTAAGHAQRAADHLHAYQPGGTPAWPAPRSSILTASPTAGATSPGCARSSLRPAARTGNRPCSPTCPTTAARPTSAPLPAATGSRAYLPYWKHEYGMSKRRMRAFQKHATA
jgi:antirestriction protein ArdC